MVDPQVREFPHHRLHHCKVLNVLVCLEQHLTSEQLEHDASCTPEITREGPSHVYTTIVGAQNEKREREVELRLVYM